MLETVDVSCARGDRVLFSGLTFTLRPGEGLAVMGSNGAGKTSLLRALCGFLPPARGRILWEGQPIGQIRESYATRLLYVGHLNGLKGDLTPAENLRFAARLCGEPCDDAAIEDALETVGLGRHMRALPTRALSQGQQRRAALAPLWFSTRPLWVLDEPLAALDEAGIRLLTHRLQTHLGNGGMAVIATHQEVGLDAGAMRLLKLVG